MRQLKLLLPWLLCATAGHASACAINEQDLLQSWSRSKGGDFEEFKLAREGGVRSFSSFLDHRLEMTGSWIFTKCLLHVANGSNAKLSFDYKVVSLDKGVLTLQDRDSGETSVYKRLR
ncbi:hypothetical protein RugamoR57_32510 [Duganella caerulea]|uniref:hypothetical protein n=1 Tax=Duganella caerulea TaxID=2885762 RepID=UPI0030EA3B18